MRIAYDIGAYAARDIRTRGEAYEEEEACASACASACTEERVETRESGERPREGVTKRRRGGVQGQRDKERTDETTGAGEKEITAGSDRVVEINVARLIGATEECACGPSGSQPARRIFSATSG